MIEKEVVLNDSRVLTLPRTVHPSIAMEPPNPARVWNPDEPCTWVLKLQVIAPTEDEAVQNLEAAWAALQKAIADAG